MRILGLTITRTPGSTPAQRIDYHRDAEPTTATPLPAHVAGFALGAGPGRTARQATCGRCGIRLVRTRTGDWAHVSLWSETHVPDPVHERDVWPITNTHTRNEKGDPQ